jgi:hypothetical protein
MVLGFTKSLIEMSTKNLPGDEAWPARKADTPIPFWVDFLESVGASTSHNPVNRDNIPFIPVLDCRDWENNEKPQPV